ncbi:MAG: hypothetical protein ACU0CO_01065 [Shimia sp.]
MTTLFSDARLGRIRALSAVLLAAMALAPAALAEGKPVEDGWGTVGFAWNTGEGLFVRFAVFDDQGMVQACMAFASNGGRVIEFNEAILERSTLRTRNGETIVRNFRWASIHSTRNIPTRLEGKPGTCKTYGNTPFEEGFDVARIDFGSGPVRIDGGH